MRGMYRTELILLEILVIIQDFCWIPNGATDFYGRKCKGVGSYSVAKEVFSVGCGSGPRRGLSQGNIAIWNRFSSFNSTLKDGNVVGQECRGNLWGDHFYLILGGIKNSQWVRKKVGEREACVMQSATSAAVVVSFPRNSRSALRSSLQFKLCVVLSSSFILKRHWNWRRCKS